MEKLGLSKVQAIGLFVLLTLIATFAVVNFLRGEDIFKRSTTYYANFEKVDGLVVTGPVNLKGLKVGMVEAIEYNMETDIFEVEFKCCRKQLNKQFRHLPSRSCDGYTVCLGIFSSSICECGLHFS